MDNTENVTPVGGEGATSSQDNATVSTQPVETATPVSDGQPAEAGQASTPWDNDPRFKGKSPEDIYKAYTESEKVIGQLSQKAQLANKLSEKYGVSPEQVLSQIEQQELQEKQAYYANNPLAPVLDEVNQLKAIIQQNEQEKAQNAVKADLDKFLKASPGFEAHKDKLLKLATTPGIGFDPKTGDEVPFEDLANEYFGAARAQGQQDAYRKIETKQMTQATSVSQAPSKGKPTLEELRSMTYAERIAVLPHGPNT